MGVSAPSIQAFGLRASIFEAEELAAEDWRVIEVHPEVSFCAMAGRPPTHSKKSWNGVMERIRLLAAAGCGIQSHIGAAGVAGVDDVLDACAAAWSAERYRTGEAISLPAPPEQIGARSVAIWY